MTPIDLYPLTRSLCLRGPVVSEPAAILPVMERVGLVTGDVGEL